MGSEEVVYFAWDRWVAIFANAEWPLGNRAYNQYYYPRATDICMVISKMDYAKLIREHRLGTGKTDVEIAKSVGLTIHEYGDIEQHASELETGVAISVARNILSAVGLGLQDIVPCGNSAGGSNLSPCEMVKCRREELGYSVADLAEKIGFEDGTIIQLESDRAFGLTLPISVVMDVETTLHLPIGSLLQAIWTIP